MIEYVPYTNFHELNLDWIIAIIKQLDKKVDSYLEYNSIKYADPLLWNITSQYEVNTVVVTSDGTAYISVQPVPTGISISRTEYWTPIGNFTELFQPIKEAVSEHDNGYTPTSLFTMAEGDLFWFENVLYQTLTAVNAGDAFVVGTNCQQVTIEELITPIESSIDAVEAALATVEDDITAIQADITAHGDAISALQTSMTAAEGNITDLQSMVSRHYYDTTEDRDWVIITSQAEFEEYLNGFNKGYNSKSCYITAPGTYKFKTEDSLTYPVLNGCQMHIYVQAHDVNIDVNCFTFYTGHFVLMGDTVDGTTYRPKVIDTSTEPGRAFYGEGSTMQFENVDFYTTMSSWHNGLLLNNCRWYNYKADRNVCLDLFGGNCVIRNNFEVDLGDFKTPTDGIFGMGINATLTWTGRFTLHRTDVSNTGYFARTRQDGVANINAFGTVFDPDNNAAYSSSNRGTLLGYSNNISAPRVFHYSNSAFMYTSANSQTLTTSILEQTSSNAIG